MKKTLMSRTFLLAVVAIAFCSNYSRGDISLTFSRADAPGDTSLTIFGIGEIETNGDDRLSFTRNRFDSFIVPDTPNLAPAVISPGLTLGGQALSLEFLGDANFGANTRPESLISFRLNGTLETVNLADLSGDYTLQGVPFASFVPGSYPDLQRESGTREISPGAISIDVIAIPEPSAICLFSMAAICCSIRRRRQ